VERRRRSGTWGPSQPASTHTLSSFTHAKDPPLLLLCCARRQITVCSPPRATETETIAPERFESQTDKLQGIGGDDDDEEDDELRKMLSSRRGGFVARGKKLAV